MQVQSVSASNKNLNFGMALKASPEVVEFMKTFNKRQLKQLAKITNREKSNNYDIYLSMEKGSTGKKGKNKEYFTASVAYKKFDNRGIFATPISALKKAQKFAWKLYYGTMPDLDKLL